MSCVTFIFIKNFFNWLGDYRGFCSWFFVFFVVHLSPLNGLRKSERKTINHERHEINEREYVNTKDAKGIASLSALLRIF